MDVNYRMSCNRIQHFNCNVYISTSHTCDFYTKVPLSALVLSTAIFAVNVSVTKYVQSVALAVYQFFFCLIHFFLAKLFQNDKE